MFLSSWSLRPRSKPATWHIPTPLFCCHSSNSDAWLPPSCTSEDPCATLGSMDKEGHLPSQGQLRNKPNSLCGLNSFTINQAQSHTGSGDEAVDTRGVVTLPPTCTSRFEETTGATSQHRWDAGAEGYAPKGSGSSDLRREMLRGFHLTGGRDSQLRVHKGPNTTAQNPGFTRSFQKHLHKLTAALIRTMTIGPNKPE